MTKYDNEEQVIEFERFVNNLICIDCGNEYTTKWDQKIERCSLCEHEHRVGLQKIKDQS